MKFSFLGRGPGEINFTAINVAEAWRKWKQSMQFYINATMAKKTEKEKYSFFLFSIGEAGREIFNTWVWPKVVDEEGEPTDEDEITVAALFKKFEDYCKPKRNLIVERHKFNIRRQNPGKSVDHYITELKTLAASCEYGNLTDDLITSQLVAGIQSDKVRDRLLREGSELTLQKTIDICRSHEVTQQQVKLFHGELEVDVLHKSQSDKHKRSRQHYIANNKSSTARHCGKQVQDGKTDKTNVMSCRNCGRNHEVWQRVSQLSEEKSFYENVFNSWVKTKLRTKQRSQRDYSRFK